MRVRCFVDNERFYYTEGGSDSGQGEDLLHTVFDDDDDNAPSLLMHDDTRQPVIM